MKYVTGEIGYTMDRPSAVSLGKFDGFTGDTGASG